MLQTPLTPLLKTARQRSYPKGQIIFYPGDGPTDMLVLRKGQVKLYDIDEQGNEKILHIFRPPAILPLAAYIIRASAETLWFYACLSDTEVYILPYQDLKPHMLADAALATYLLGRAASEMHELLVRLASMGKSTTQDKLIAALKFLGVHHATLRDSNGWRRVQFPVSHQLLADLTGITRESTSMAMKQLQADKVIRYPRLTVLEINFQKLIHL